MARLRWIVPIACAVALAGAGCHGGAARTRDAGAAEASSGYTVGWGQIRMGMTPDQVLKMLDEPLNIKVTGVSTYWYYSERGSDGPHVVFGTRANTVESWRTPE